MIVRLTGTLIGLAEDSIVVERDGVAREILVPPFTITELAARRGQYVTLHTVEFYENSQSWGHLVPRLLGFLHTEDRLFYSRFISVKGIGPRKALKALTEPVSRIAAWIESGDAKALAHLPGIGARAAQLIVASLRGKMDDLALSAASAAEQAPRKLTQAQRDALEVLVAWGDSRVEAHRWLDRVLQVRPDLDATDELVRSVYRVKVGAEA